MKFLVLGAGKQGSAAAYDLLENPDVEQVFLADARVDELRPFLEPFRGGRLLPMELDAGDHERTRAAMEPVNAVLCALPYYYNFPMARLAVEAGCHYCDLGGNTDIVEQQLALDDEARERGLSVVPDCGLAPGMVNILAQAGIDALDETDSVKIWVGGLPQHPEPPLNYHIVYSLEGVLDYYTTDAVILEDGEEKTVEALAGLETVTFPAPVGELEAFYTAGGISTMPERYRGRIREMAYKTLRYPGHAQIMKAIRELGLLDTEPVMVEHEPVVPREFFIEVVSPKLRRPDAPDLVAVRVEVSGRKDGAEATLRWDLVDFNDAETGITAMMRTTGFSLSITALMQVDGRIGTPGVATSDYVVPAQDYVEELGRRGVMIETSRS